MEDFAYDITFSQEKFNSLKADERFLGLLTLARIVNALRFCNIATIDSANDSSPSGARSLINSFLFAASILYEGFLTIEKLGEYFNTCDSYRNGFGVLLKDNDVKTFRKTILCRIRNRFVFHFDKNVARESFNHFQLPVYKFASGIGITSGEMYFGLADEAVINYLLQPSDNESDESVKTRYKKIVQDTAKLIIKFIESAERLMADVIDDMGFELSKRPV